MGTALAASDLWPLVLKLTRDEQVRLARLALTAAASADGDASAYGTVPPGAIEFACDDDPLAWDGHGWDDFSASPSDPHS